MSKSLQSFSHLVLLLALAFVLRRAGGDWDNGHLLHPDERFMCMVTAQLDAAPDAQTWFDTAASPFNPYNRGFSTYVYGTLPLRIVHAVSAARGIRDLADIARIGRLVSALFDTATVALLFLLALRLGGARLASASALLLAFCVLSIQHAHFYTVDAAGVFFATLCVGLGLVAVKEKRLTLLLASAASVGLAMACRLNLGLLALWVIAAALSLAWTQRSWKPLAILAAGGALALLLFRILQPYAFDASGFWPRGLNSQWLADIRQVRAISDGTLEVPFTLQWVGRTPWLFALHNLAAWGMGWPLGLLSLGGALFLLWTHRFRPGHWLCLLPLWPLLLIAYHGNIHLHTMRYFLPAYPALILCGTLALRRVEPPIFRRLLYGLVAGLTIVYALFFVNMYRQPHPRIAASRWLYEHLPADGIVAGEHWDDALPLRLRGSEPHHAGLRFLDLPVYDPDTPEKLRALLEAIDRADYLVLSSNRASDTLPRVPLRWPVMARFYERLLSPRSDTRIGLREVARFERYPAFGNWTLNSHAAEEAFQVYDHPLVRIYEKTPVWHVDVLHDLLAENIDFPSIPDIRYRHAGRWNNGWLTPDEWNARTTGSPSAQLFPANAAGNRAPLLTWIIVLFTLGPVSLPVAGWLFPTLRDRGACVARLVGLLAIGWLAWLPAASGLLRFGQSLHLAGTLWFALAAILFAWKHEDLFRSLRRNARRILFSEILFWSVFAFFLWLRSLQPDLWHPWAGGEKPMDLAFLTSTAQSPFFPPPNPWLSGAFLNYYYYGFVLCSGLIRATGILPSTAYNLLLPTFAALTAGAVFAIASSLVSAFRSRPGRRGTLSAGLLAVLLTLFLGNFGQVRWLLQGRPGHGNSGYWAASRVINVPEGDVQPITEFPFFSQLYGDLHAHVMALPIAAFCLLLSLQLLRRFHPVRLFAAALALGSLWITNAWDFPVQAAILAFVLLFPAFKKRFPLPDTRLLLSRIGWTLLALAAARLLFLPFHAKTLAHPAAFVLWKGARSSLFDLFLAHGLFWIPLGLGIWHLGLHQRNPSGLRHAPWTARFLPALLVAGCLFLTLFVELFALRDDIGRMNTVFKFYYQIWWILACVSAVILAAALHSPRCTWKLRIALLLPLLLSALYPLTSIPAKRRDRYWPSTYRGLDGLAYLRDAHWQSGDNRLPLAPDLDIIRWLRRNAQPFDILLEAQLPEYQWGSRISWHSGLPAVLGWNWHMRQQRPFPGADRVVWERAADIDRFYRGPDIEESLAIARRYKVRFIILGGLEQQTYGPEALQKFDNHPQLRPVLRSPHSRILELLP